MSWLTDMPAAVDVKALQDELSDRQADVAELSAENERLAAELQDERTARLLVDNRVTELEDAIREHRRLILERVPAEVGTQDRRSPLVVDQVSGRWKKVVPHSDHRCVTPVVGSEGVGSVWVCRQCGMKWRLTGRTESPAGPPLCSWTGTPKRRWFR